MYFIFEHLTYFWLIVAFFCLMVEMGSPGLFFFLSFFVGALAAAGASLLFSSLVVQGAVFLGGTIVALYVLKRLIAQKMFKDHPYGRTNVFAMQGKHGMMVKDVMPDKSGEVRINGEIWTARADDSIKKGEAVEVISVRGAHVVVKKL